MKYKRVLLKLSGEALMGNRQYGIDNDRLIEYAKEIKKVVDGGCELAIVIGGGNISVSYTHLDVSKRQKLLCLYFLLLCLKVFRILILLFQKLFRIRLKLDL